MRRFAVAANYRRREFKEQALDHLRSLPWRGNVRELQNLVERLLILSPGEKIELDDVRQTAGGSATDLSATIASAGTLREFRNLVEKQFLIRKLEENGWNVTQTAKAIDTPRSNLYKKMEAFEIKRQEA